MLISLSIAAFITAVLCLFLGAYAYSIDRQSVGNKLFFIICASCSLWALTFMVGNYSPDKSINWIAYRCSAIVWSVIPSMSLHFILTLTKTRLPVKKGVQFLILYLPATVFLLQAWFGTLLYSDFVRTPYGWIGVTPQNTVWPKIFGIYMALFLFSGVAISFFWGVRSPDEYIKKQSLTFSLSMIVCVGLSVLTDVLFPILGFAAIPSIGSILSLSWVLGCWYAIVHYRMMITSPSVVFDDIIGNIRDLIIFCNPKGIILKVNLEMTQLLQLPEKEIIGKPLATYLTKVPLFKQEHSDGFFISQELSETKSKYFDNNKRQRFHCTLPDETIIPVTGYTAAINDHSNRIVGSIIIAQDIRPHLLLLREISERTLAQAELAQARDCLEAMVHERTSQLEMANQELRREIEERRQIEEQFRQAQKMEIIGQLVSGVTHDLNNLLTPIQGYSEYIEMACARASKQEDAVLDITKMIRWSTGIHNASMRARDLVQKLLTISRKTSPQECAVNIHTVLDDVIHLFAQISKRTITITKTFSDQPCVVMANQSQIHSAFLNLAINARDAMPDGGALSFSTTTLKRAELPTDLLMVTRDDPFFVSATVADTGSGMTPETRANIFEPFFTTKEPGKGTGLGLASVYRTVANYGGNIQVTSSLDNGTSITLFFPQHEEEVIPVSLPQTTTAHRNNSKGTIMVIDDEDSVRSLVTEVLRDAGYTVDEWCESKEAIKHFVDKKDKIDLIITDMNMPVMGGHELIAAMQQYKPEQQFIIMTGYGAGEVFDESIAQSVFANLQKPFELEKLISIVEHALIKS